MSFSTAPSQPPRVLIHRPSRTAHGSPLTHKPRHHRGAAPLRAFHRSDFDAFARRVSSGDALRDAWRGANEGFEQIAFEARRAAERLDRRFALSQRFNSAARAAVVWAREVDNELGVGRRWWSFSVDFSRNWPRYRKELNEFVETPLGKAFATIFFLWFALSGWMFNFIIFAMWVLPFAVPLLIGTLGKSLAIEGSCPACKRPFVGLQNQIIVCTGCRNIVWQPKDGFSRGQGNSSKTSQGDIIDIDIDDK